MKIIPLTILVVAAAYFLLAPTLIQHATAFTGCDKTSKISECITSIKTDVAEPAGLASDAKPAQVLVRIIQWMLTLVALLAMVAIVWGGIMYIISFGNEQRAETAKKIILFAIVGVIITILSLVIITTVQSFLVGSLPLVHTAHAADDLKRGFKTGVDTIKAEIVTDDSGLAKETNFLLVIRRIILFSLALVSILALAVLIWGGIMYILSIGDDKRAERAKKIILYAIIGIIVSLLAFTILSLVRTAITGDGATLFMAHTAWADETACDDKEGGFGVGFDCAKATATKGKISDLAPRDTILKIIRLLLSLVAVIAVAVFIWGGFTYITSLGNDERIQKAKKILLYSIIGLIVIGMSVIIVNFLLHTFTTS